MTYTEFKEMLDQKILSGNEIYENLLATVIKNPERYCGLFRLTNAKSKLVQNLTQSQEIKFGDFMEELVTDYFKNRGYINLHKNLGNNIDGDRLTVDQYFIKDNDIYFIEQKVRDDHDSTKKRGQFDNFIKKYEHIKSLNPDKKIIGYMWFIDDGLRKNKKYYSQEMENLNFVLDEIELFYGGELFEKLGLDSDWEEILDHLTTLREENSADVISIPDFDTSEIIYEAMLNLPNNLWNRLNSNKEIYKLLRKELFPTGFNIEKAKNNR